MNAIQTSDIIVAHLNICNVINIYIKTIWNKLIIHSFLNIKSKSQTVMLAQKKRINSSRELFSEFKGGVFSDIIAKTRKWETKTVCVW